MSEYFKRARVRKTPLTWQFRQERIKHSEAIREGFSSELEHMVTEGTESKITDFIKGIFESALFDSHQELKSKVHMIRSEIGHNEDPKVKKHTQKRLGHNWSPLSNWNKERLLAIAEWCEDKERDPAPIELAWKLKEKEFAWITTAMKETIGDFANAQGISEVHFGEGKVSTIELPLKTAPTGKLEMLGDTAGIGDLVEVENLQSGEKTIGYLNNFTNRWFNLYSDPQQIFPFVKDSTKYQVRLLES